MQCWPRYSLLSMFVVLLSLTACGGGVNDDEPGPPTVTSRTPAPGDDNVAVREPFVATFSEAIDPSTLSDSSVVVTGSGSTLLGKTLSLSGNGTTMTIELISSPFVPNNLTVTLTDSITDLSGDSLTLPADAWTFFAPDWLELGSGRSEGDSGSYQPSLAVDGSNKSVVAWREYDGIYVQRWNGTSWDSLGTARSAASGAAAYPSLAIDSADNPVVAWHEHDGSTYNIYVQRWNGTSWDSLGTARSAASGAAENPSLAIDSADRPIVAWHEHDGSTQSIYVQRWDESTTSWGSAGGALSATGGSTPAVYPSLGIDDSGAPVVAWRESDSTINKVYVRRYNQ